MATAFPANPVDGQLYTVGGYTYQYSAAKYSWTKVAQTTAVIGNVSIVGNTVSTSTGTSTTSITGNTITTGNATSNTTITGNTVTTGNATSNTSITGNTVTINTTTGNTSLTGNTITTGNATSNTSITGNTVTINTTTGNTTITGNTITTGNATSNTQITGNTITTGNATSNTTITGNTITTGNATSNTQITGNTVTISTGASNTAITGNTITIGNATSNTSVTSNSIVTTTITGTNISVLGNIVGGNLLTVGIVSATGNITGGNIITTGRVSISGNIDANNIGALNSLTASVVSASANITGGNINTGGAISAVGNIWGGGVRSTASATEPTNPGQGDIWYNTATDVVYRYTFDGTSYYWIDYYGSTLGQNANILAVNNGTSSVAVPTTDGNIVLTVGGSTAGTFSSSGLSVGNIINSNAGNGVGNIGSSSNYFNTIFSTTYTGVHADLAENYQSDRQYLPGTVVVFGGDKEVTISPTSHDTRVAGVVSTKPAFVMNDQYPGLLVALTGKTPAYVMGPVSKGDRLVNITSGVAGRLNPELAQLGCIVGKALEDHPDAGQVKLIQIAIGRT